MAFMELPKREDRAPLWERLLDYLSFPGLIAVALLSLFSLFSPPGGTSFVVWLAIVTPTIGSALYLLHRQIKGTERLWYALTSTTLTIEHYRSALHIPLADIEYLQVLPLGGVKILNGFPGYRVGKAKVPALGKKVMVIASSVQGEGLLIGYRQAKRAEIHEVIITPEHPKAIKDAFQAFREQRLRA